MSYDLAVFDVEAAPKTRDDFLAWYDRKTEWNEPIDYNDPGNLSPSLRKFFNGMIELFPPLNGPLRYEPKSDLEEDPDEITDYCMSNDLIYMGFRWSVVDAAFAKVKEAAQLCGVGFFNVSSEEGEIVLPTAH